MSGESPTEADVKAALAKMPYAQTLGIEAIMMGQELTMVMPFKDEIIGNPVLRALHGGAVGAFMETTAIVQLLAASGGTSVPKPIGISIDYLRRGNPKDTYARASVARQGSRVANVRVRAWQDNARAPIAILHGHFLNAEG